MPVLVRWRFGLEPTLFLKVTINVLHHWGAWQNFYTCIDTGRRVTVPKLVRDMLTDRQDERQCLIGTVLDVRIEPRSEKEKKRNR